MTEPTLRSDIRETYSRAASAARSGGSCCAPDESTRFGAALSDDKPAVVAEMARLLRPGGRIGISDVVAEDQLDACERAARGSAVGCIAGALSVSEYGRLLADAGFTAISVEFTHAVADGMHAAIVRALR